jgi:hypothetical protein
LSITVSTLRLRESGEAAAIASINVLTINVDTEKDVPLSFTGSNVGKNLHQEL